MGDPVTAFPLSWPASWPRTQPSDRIRARFSRNSQMPGSSWSRRVELSVSVAIDRVLAELRGFGVGRENIIISTNLDVRLDGLPRSGQRMPDDPGAAVYWRRNRDEAQRCMAIDQYDRVPDNLAAIAATLGAMRAIERHGGAEILDRAFSGFAALPPAGGTTSPTWWGVLGVERTASPDVIRSSYRALARQHHPDLGGDAEQFVVVQKAYEQAQKERQFA